MQEHEARWLASELEECLGSWQGAIETEGHGSYAAVAWEGRADQALRTALHFGLLTAEDARALVVRIDPRAPLIRALAEPDGEDGD